MALSQPGESEELKIQSERVREGAGAIRAGLSPQIALSPGAACEPRADQLRNGTRVVAPPVPVARLGVLTKPAQFPFFRGGDLRKPKSRDLPAPAPPPAAVRAGSGGCQPRGRLRLFF